MRRIIRGRYVASGAGRVLGQTGKRDPQFALQARNISNRMRLNEHKAMVEERLDQLGDVYDGNNPADGYKGPTRTVQLLESKRLDEIPPSQLFRCDDTKTLLEKAGDFVHLICSKAQGAELSDKWTAGFLLSMYTSLRRFSIPVPPAKTIVQTIKEFEKPKYPFEVGTMSNNVLLTVMYQEKVDVQSAYGIYARFKERKIRPNQQTYPIMFNISLRAHKQKNASNFFAACEKLLSNPDISFLSKHDIIHTLLLGIQDTQSSDYGERLMRFIKNECMNNELIPPSIPDSPSARQSMHLYLSSPLADRVLSSTCRIRSPAVVELAQQWCDFLHKRGYTSPKLRANLMRLYATNGECASAFRIWDQILKHTDDKDLATHHIRSACSYVLETAARSRREQLIPESRRMMEAMISRRIITASNDKVDLYVMQIKLLVMTNEFEKAKDLYHEIKHDCRDDNVVQAFCVGPYVKEPANLEVLNKVFFDFKEMTEASEKGQVSLDRAQDKYLGVLADCGEFKQVHDIMKSLAGKGKVSLELIHKVLQACARDKDATSYGTFYRWSEGGHDDMPLYFSHLKNNKATRKNCSVAEGIFESMKDFGLEPITKTYNHLMAVYSAAGDNDSVSRIYNMLQDDPNLQPDQHSFYYVARSWAGKGAVDQVGNVFDDMLKTAKNESSEFAFTPDFCAQAIRALANTGTKIETVAYMRNVNPGEEVDWMDDQPAKIVTSKQPRSVEVDTGFKLLNALKELSISPTPRVYTALLGLCTRAGDFKRAEEVYTMLRKDDPKGYYDHSDVVTSLMKMHYTRNSMDDALALLNEVTLTDAGSLDHTAYHNCISTCASHGHIANAKAVLTLMLQDPNIKVTDTAIALAIMACAHSKPDVDVDEEDFNRLDRARDILREYRDLNKVNRDKVPVVNSLHVFHKLLYVCALSKNSRAAYEYLQEMKEYNIVVDKLAMMYVARSLSSVHEIAEFLQTMQQERLEPDTGIVFRLLEVCRTGSDAFTALDIVTRYPMQSNEKLNLLFFRIVEKAKLSEADYATCNTRFHEVFAKTLEDLKQLGERRARELAKSTGSVGHESEPSQTQQLPTPVQEEPQPDSGYDDPFADPDQQNASMF